MNIVTKVFIVLFLIASVGLAVVVFMWMPLAQNYKDAMVAERTGKIAAMAAVGQARGELAALQTKYDALISTSAKDLLAVRSERDLLAADKVSKATQNDALTAQLQDEVNKSKVLGQTNAQLTLSLNAKETELQAMRPEFQKAVRMKAEVDRTNNDLSNQLELAQKAIRALQEELQVVREKLVQAQQNKAPGAAAGGEFAVQVASLSAAPMAAQINGKVSAVGTSQDKLYVTLALGSRDGVTVGSRFVIYRGNNYVGDAVVQRVTVDEAVAVVKPVREGEAVRVGDLVMTPGGM